MKASRPRGRGLSQVSSSAGRRELLAKMNMDAQAFALVGVVVFGILALAQPVQIWYEQRLVMADLQVQNERTRESLAQMKEDLKRWDDPVYIRSQARSRLFYVMPGEISFTVMDAEGTDANDASGTVGAALAAARNTTDLSKSVSNTKTNWTENLVETVVRAGLEEPKG
jgi:cell division protein FtsB